MTKLSIFVLLCVYLGQWPTSVKSVSSSLMQSLPQRRINRHFNGDIFVEQGCGYNLCSGVRYSQPLRGGGGCQCQCPAERPTYREDTKQCVDNVPECELADFSSGNSSEKIPFVFLPLAGQLIYPSAEIVIPGTGSATAPVCVVSTLNIMVSKESDVLATAGSGWIDVQNTTSDEPQFQQPFQLFRDGGRTLLQWMGDDKLLDTLEGRLVLVNLLCKDLSRKENSLYSPCIAFRVAGSPGKKRKDAGVYQGAGSGGTGSEGTERLTEREYLAIGICSGFLLMLYLFAMIIFILIRRRHQRDKRLREQFLNMPLPPGLGYKSSRILGLEGDQSNLNTRFGSGFNPYFPNAGGKLRQSTRSSNGGGIVGNGSGQADGNGMHCSLHTGDGNDHHDHIYDITKKTGSVSGSESDASVVLEMNEKLLEAHKKVVQNKLNREVARTIHDSAADAAAAANGDVIMDQQRLHMMRMQQHQHQVAAAMHAAAARRLQGGSGQLVGVHHGFAPNLEGIPEEHSRANTLKNKDEDEDGAENVGGNDDSHDGGSKGSKGSMKSNKTDTTGSAGSSGSQPTLKKHSSSDPHSIDSGIQTRPSSVSELSDNHSDSTVDVATSNEIDSDDDTVDVADDSDINDGDETDSFTYVDSPISKSVLQSAAHNSQHFNETSNKVARRRNKDFLSEIYNTEVLKVPRMRGGTDTESVYSTNSNNNNNRKEFEYDSLDMNNRSKLRDIYTNPALTTTVNNHGAMNRRNAAAKASGDPKDDYEVVNVADRHQFGRFANGHGHKYDNGADNDHYGSNNGHHKNDNVAEVYINNEYTEDGIWQGGNTVTGSESADEEAEPKNYEYSAAGERMLISISGDNESVYSNKILISVNNHDSGQSRGHHSKPNSPNAELYFDQDTLERSNFPDRPMRGQEYRNDLADRNSRNKNIYKLKVSNNEEVSPNSTPVNSKQKNGGFYLFNDADRNSSPSHAGHVNGTPLRSLPGNGGLHRSSPSHSINNLNQHHSTVDKPSLPPKTRGMPKLPPKPMHNGNGGASPNTNTLPSSTGTPPRIGQRPLPPPPPPPPGN